MKNRIAMIVGCRAPPDREFKLSLYATGAEVGHESAHSLWRRSLDAHLRLA